MRYKRFKRLQEVKAFRKFLRQAKIPKGKWGLLPEEVDSYGGTNIPEEFHEWLKAEEKFVDGLWEAPIFWTNDPLWDRSKIVRTQEKFSEIFHVDKDYLCYVPEKKEIFVYRGCLRP